MKATMRLVVQYQPAALARVRPLRESSRWFPSLEVSNEGHQAACRAVPARRASKGSAVDCVIEVVSLAGASGWYWEVFRLL